MHVLSTYLIHYAHAIAMARDEDVTLSYLAIPQFTPTTLLVPSTGKGFQYAREEKERIALSVDGRDDARVIDNDHLLLGEFDELRQPGTWLWSNGDGGL